MATPIFASIVGSHTCFSLDCADIWQINRINEERIAAGKSVLGFLNPTLYAHPEILNDITVC